MTPPNIHRSMVEIRMGMDQQVRGFSMFQVYKCLSNTLAELTFQSRLLKIIGFEVDVVNISGLCLYNFRGRYQYVGVKIRW